MPLQFILVNIRTVECCSRELGLYFCCVIVKFQYLISHYDKMVITCSAPGCSAKKDNVNTKTTVLFHRFPLKKPDVLAKWVKAMKNSSFKPTVKSYVCSAHFTASDYEAKPTNAGKQLKSNAVPTVFEKRRPGRKKKLISENNISDVKENEDSITKQETEDNIQEEYLEVSPTEKDQSNLAEIIGNQEKETVQILIVGEDGKITNSEYILKKELFTVDDTKEDSGAGAIEETRTQDIEDEDSLEIKKDIDEKFDDIKISDSSDISLLKYRDLRNREKIKSLETTLMTTRKQVQTFSLKCKKMKKRLNRLKLLLKLLVLKRGRGEKNLKQLLEDYGKELDTNTVKVKEESNF